MTVRNKGVAGSEQTLVWDAENRLAEVQDANGNTQERYWAEAVTDWVYQDLYMPPVRPQPSTIYRMTDDQRDYIKGVFRGP